MVWNATNPPKKQEKFGNSCIINDRWSTSDTNFSPESVTVQGELKPGEDKYLQSKKPKKLLLLETDAPSTAGLGPLQLAQKIPLGGDPLVGMMGF